MLGFSLRSFKRNSIWNLATPNIEGFFNCINIEAMLQYRIHDLQYRITSFDIEVDKIPSIWKKLRYPRFNLRYRVKTGFIIYSFRPGWPGPCWPGIRVGHKLCRAATHKSVASEKTSDKYLRYYFARPWRLTRIAYRVSPGPITAAADPA